MYFTTNINEINQKRVLSVKEWIAERNLKEYEKSMSPGNAVGTSSMLNGIQTVVNGIAIGHTAIIGPGYLSYNENTYEENITLKASQQ